MLIIDLNPAMLRAYVTSPDPDIDIAYVFVVSNHPSFGRIFWQSIQSQDKMGTSLKISKFARVFIVIQVTLDISVKKRINC
jgi:hypothetical protein